MAELYQFNAFRERLESFAVGLHDSDGDMAALAHVDISDDARLAFVPAVDNFTRRTVYQC